MSEALDSPITDQAGKPPLNTTSGLMPKNFGSQSTMSASLPASSEPISPSMPYIRAALIVTFAT
jgi:hypothetical protein